MPTALNVAQVTDTHLLASPEGELLGQPTEKSFAAVVARLHELRPQLDLVLLTGDLSQDGSPESYRRVQEAIAPLGLPVYWLPGNHDRHLTMQQVLREPPFSTDKAFRCGEWQFVLLNSAVSGRVEGCLSAGALAWLEQQLARSPSCPTLVGLHHPPVTVFSRWIDQTQLQNAKALFAVLDRHPQVRLVTFGHVHQDYCCWRRGVCYSASPSTSIQFKPRSDRFALDDNAPGFRLLALHADGSFSTRVERVAFAQSLDYAALGY